MNESTADQPEQLHAPIGFPFVVIAAWLCAVAVVALAREVSLADSLVWQHNHNRYDSGTFWWLGCRFYGLAACALCMLPLGVWLGRSTAPRVARRRWLYAGAVTLLVATLVPVARTAALVSDADRFLHRTPNLRLSRLSPYARQDLMLIGRYTGLLLVPGGLGYALGWTLRTLRSRRLREKPS